MNINPTLKDLNMSVPVKPLIYKNVDQLSVNGPADRRDLYFAASNCVHYRALPEGPGELLNIVPARQQYTNFKRSIIDDFRLVVPSHYDVFHAKHKQPTKQNF